MQPVSNPSTTSCGTTMSSTCVIWPGPDLACIDLCKGDSINKGLAKIAELICAAATPIIDVANLDFKCLVDEGTEAPADLQNTIQLLIDAYCTQNADPAAPDAIEYELPECLYQAIEGGFITSLPAKEFSEYVAEQVCYLISRYQELATVIQNHEQRITALEQASDPESSLPEITSQCISGTPGEQTPLPTAFIALESYLCDLKGALGENTDLTNAVTKQCSTIASSPSLANPGVNVSSLAGWTNNPSTIAESIGNLWVVVCDIRAKLDNC